MFPFVFCCRFHWRSLTWVGVADSSSAASSHSRRICRKLTPTAAATKGTKPLKDMKFHVIGASLKKDFIKILRSLGAKGTRALNDKIVACVTTKG